MASLPPSPTSVKTDSLVTEVSRSTPHRIRKYKPEWELLPECRGWLTRGEELGPGGEAKALCKWCGKTLRNQLMDIKRHGKTTKHKYTYKLYKDGKTKSDKISMKIRTPRMQNEYQDEWEENPQFASWLIRGEYGARCKACELELQPELKSLKRHAYLESHIEAVARMDRLGGHRMKNGKNRTTQGLMMASTSKVMGPHSQQLTDNKRREIELRIALVSGLKHGFNGLLDLCCVMNQTYGIDTFKMSKAECQSLFKIQLVPYLFDLIKGDMKDAPFSIILDNELNTEGTLNTCLYYYSPSNYKPVMTFLGTLDLRHLTPLMLVDSITTLLTSWGLEASNLVSISLGLVQDILSDMDELVAVLGNAFSSAMINQTSLADISSLIDKCVRENFPSSVPYLIRESCNWFLKNQRNKVVYSELVEHMGLTQEPEILNNSCQWIQISRIVSNLVCNYDCLKNLFQESAKGDLDAKNLVDLFNDDQHRLYLCALQPLLIMFNEICKEAADNKPTHFSPAKRKKSSQGDHSKPSTLDHVINLFRSIGEKILDPNLLTENSDLRLCFLDLNEQHEAVIVPDHITIGVNFDSLYSGLKLSQETKVKVKSLVSQFLHSVFSGLQNILKNAIQINEDFKVFQVNHFLKNNLDKNRLRYPFFDRDEEVLKDILTKYELMKILDWINVGDTLRFWQEIHNFGDSTGKFPLRCLSLGVRKLFTVPLFHAGIPQFLKRIGHIRNMLPAVEDPTLVNDIIVCRTGLEVMRVNLSELKIPEHLYIKRNLDSYAVMGM